MTKVSPYMTVLLQVCMVNYCQYWSVCLFREETVTLMLYKIDIAAHVWNVRPTALTKVKLHNFYGKSYDCSQLFDIVDILFIRLIMIEISLFSVRLWWRKTYAWKRHGTVPSVARRQHRTFKVWHGHGWWWMDGK